MTFQTKSRDFTDIAQVVPFPQTPPAAKPLRRAPTLIRAAKWRAKRYRRARDLPRLGSGLASMREGSVALIVGLSEIEEECWAALTEGAAHYAPERHILALAALLAERAAQPERPAGQSVRR